VATITGQAAAKAVEAVAKAVVAMAVATMTDEDRLTSS
jgi:hypothetical protein